MSEHLTASPPAPVRVQRFPTLGSTNDEAMAQARAGEPGPLWIIAETQTGGRGRRGRVWSSPRGNLYASLLLNDPCDLSRAPELGFVAGVALARAVREIAGGDARFTLKWPNDLLFDGAKLSGLLLESSTSPFGHSYIVIGFGVNCASHPENLAYPATSLLEALGRPVLPDDVFTRLCAHLARELVLWQAQGFAATRSAWLALASGLGQPIRVSTGARDFTGVFRDLDATGRLILDTKTGPLTIDAGDIFPMSHASGRISAAQDS